MKRPVGRFGAAEVSRSLVRKSLVLRRVPKRAMHRSHRPRSVILGHQLLAMTANGNLQCKENVPSPTGGGNVVQGNKEDQCRRL